MRFIRVLCDIATKLLPKRRWKFRCHENSILPFHLSFLWRPVIIKICNGLAKSSKFHSLTPLYMRGSFVHTLWRTGGVSHIKPRIQNDAIPHPRIRHTSTSASTTATASDLAKISPKNAKKVIKFSWREQNTNCFFF